MNNLITLESSTLNLTSVSYKDINDIWIGTLNNLEYMKHSKNSNTAWNLKLQQEYLDSFDQFSSFLLKIECKKSQKFVGTISVKFHYHLQEVEIGVLIFEKFANSGYATESIKVIDGFLSNNFPNFRLVMGTLKNNIAMQSVIKKNGLTLKKNGSFDTLYYSKTYKQFSDELFAEIPLMVKKAKTIGVVAYDAGGAEQIFYLIKNFKKILHFRVDGPAKKILKKDYPAISEFTELKSLLNCDLILVGSGWMSNLENEAIDFFSSQNKLFFVVLDHWENYDLRFKSLEYDLPKLLIVSNKEAMNKALSVFPKSSIWITPNFQVQYHKLHLRNRIARDVLVVLEPLKNDSNLSDLTIDDYNKIIRKAFGLLEKYKLGRVVIRLHPSQSQNEKFIQNLTKKFPNIFWSENDYLIDDLKFCGVILGFHSNALYLAAKCGFRVGSMYKLRKNHWTNCIPEIQDFNQL